MFLRKAALRAVPTYAVVNAEVIEAVEATLEEDDAALQDALDRGYADLDRKQPALAAWMSEKLAGSSDELVQSLGYFLTVTVYLAFREAFPTRLECIDERAIDIAGAMLSVDEELRADDPSEILDSDDVLAMSQPAVLSYVQHHVHEALDQSGGEVDLEQLDEVYRSLLIAIIALSHTVAPPGGKQRAFD